MFEQNGVDFDWSTLFNVKKKQKVIKQLKTFKQAYNPESLASLFDFYSNSNQNNQAFIEACEIVTLDFCLNDSDFAKDVLTEEEYEKALAQFERKQYSSNLSKDILAKFYHIVNMHYDSENKINNLLIRDIRKKAREINEKAVEKSFSKLKRVIEKITAGVKADCYFLATRILYANTVEEELNKFLVENYGYDLNGFIRSNYGNTLNNVFKKTLLDDEEFWAEHEKFDFSLFVNKIYELNDARHAQKVLSFVFDKIKNDDIGAKLIENKLSFEYLNKDKLFGDLKSGMLRFFYRFENAYDLDAIRDDICCYPFIKTDSVEEKIAAGKKIISGLLKAVYPDDSEKVAEFFRGQLDNDEPYRINGYTVKFLLLGYSSSFWIQNKDYIKAASVYCPEYFDLDNVLKRIYLIAYCAAKLESDINKCSANLFEILYDLFKAVEKKFGLKTSFQKNNEGRDAAYKELKDILESYAVKISDDFKSDYVTSLLDRKVATVEETARFPALEQLGDAVYGFAVAEMMFYQPAEIEEDSIFKNYDKFVCAEAQVEIARMLGLDKLYISPMTLSYKYTRSTYTDNDYEMFVIRQTNEEARCECKYLADSLEMIIGVICKDCGYKAAIEFSKIIVKKKFSDFFKKEIRWGMPVDFEFHDANDYWNRILPSPAPYFETWESRDYYNKMWNALNKFMLAYVLGTDDKETRTFITNRYSDSERADKLYKSAEKGYPDINYAMYDYLHKGLAYVMDNYGSKLKENYKNSKQ